MKLSSINFNSVVLCIWNGSLKKLVTFRLTCATSAFIDPVEEEREELPEEADNTPGANIYEKILFLIYYGGSQTSTRR